MIHNHKLKSEAFNFLFIISGTRLRCTRCGLASVDGQLFAQIACTAPSPVGAPSDPTTTAPDQIMTHIAQSRSSTLQIHPQSNVPPTATTNIDVPESFQNIENCWEETMAATKKKLQALSSDPVSRYVDLIYTTQVKPPGCNEVLDLDYAVRYDGPDGAEAGYVCVYQDGGSDAVFEFEQSPRVVKQFYFLFCCLGRDVLRTIDFLKLHPEYFANAEISPEWRGSDDT